VRRSTDALLVGGTVFASVAIFVAAFLAWAAGALSPGVGIASLAVGIAAGGYAASVIPRDSRGTGPEGSAGRATADPSALGSTGAPQDDGARGSIRAPQDDGARGSIRAPQDDGALGVLALLAFAAVAVRQFGWIVFERDGALLTLLPYNFGDLPLHWTYVSHLAGGAPFWPENPILTGERLRYPFGVDLLTAVLVQLGASLAALLPVMGLAGSALAALALRRWGGALAVAGFLFSGGLAGFQLLWTGRVVDYQAAVDWKNLFLALFVPQRGYLVALPAGLLLLWSWRRRLLRGEHGLPPWVEGLLWGVLPLVHLHTFLFVSLVVAVWAVGGGRLRAARPALAWAVLPATWSVWQVTDGFRAASLVGWRPGWTIGHRDPLVFLLLNFGLFLPLAALAFARAVRERRREELLVLGPALGVFAALFLVRLAPWEWDNTKVMLWCYVVALVPIGSLVLSRVARTWQTALVAGLLFSGAVSVLGASLGRGPRLEVLDLGEEEGVCRALASLHTSRVATAPTFNHPVALCGRPVVAGYPGHLWSHGLDARGVEARLSRLMRGEPGWREDARALGASHVFWGPRERQAFAASTQPWAAAAPPLALGPWGALYALE